MDQTRPPASINPRRTMSWVQKTREWAITSSVMCMLRFEIASSAMNGFKVPNANECIRTATVPPFFSMSASS